MKFCVKILGSAEIEVVYKFFDIKMLKKSIQKSRFRLSDLSIFSFFLVSLIDFMFKVYYERKNLMQ